MKIHICGPYGVGKSTLAKKISSITNIPYHSLDDIKYIVKYDIIRPVNERIAKVNQICKKDKWITEGTWSDYAESAFKNADFIVLITISRVKSFYRILMRYIKRKKEKNDTLQGALNLINEVNKYYNSNQPVSLDSHVKLIKKYKKKIVIIKNNLDLNKLLDFLSKRHSNINS